MKKLLRTTYIGATLVIFTLGWFVHAVVFSFMAGWDSFNDTATWMWRDK